MLGYLHSFESLAAVDGKGVRCSVFMAGCPLRCAFCHNPDTWERGEKTASSSDLVKKIKRYQSYFGEGGGVTFSGGEPLLQAPFLLEVADLLEKENISFVLDTSGALFLTDERKELFSRADGVLLDLKFWDDESYQMYTGQGIDWVLQTLSFLEQIGKDTVIRTVVIPGINDTKEVLARYLPHLQNKKCVRDWELLPFHTMGFFKYEGLGIQNPFADKKALSQEALIPLQSFVRENLSTKKAPV